MYLHPTAELLRMSAKLIERALQVVELLAGLGQFALRGEALIVGEVAAGLRDQRIRIDRGLWRSGGRSTRHTITPTRATNKMASAIWTRFRMAGV